MKRTWKWLVIILGLLVIGGTAYWYYKINPASANEHDNLAVVRGKIYADGAVKIEKSAKPTIENTYILTTKLFSPETTYYLQTISSLSSCYTTSQLNNVKKHLGNNFQNNARLHIINEVGSYNGQKGNIWADVVNSGIPSTKIDCLVNGSTYRLFGIVKYGLFYPYTAPAGNITTPVAKSYNSTTYGINFNYPDIATLTEGNLTLTGDVDGYQILVGNLPTPTYETSVSITIFPERNGYTLNAPNGLEPTATESTTVGGQTAKKYTVGNERVTYVVLANDRRYELSYYVSSLSTFTDILASISFSN